jgi:uncharacterized phage protein (TIGR01671 family)
MKREIKFRAWDEDNKTMVYPDHSSNYDHIYAGLDTDGTLTVGYTDQNEDYHDMIVMQFTGLKDKSGHDVYEGDILELTEGGDENVIVCWNDKTASFGCQKKLGEEPYCIHMYGVEIAKTVGNIYEDKELIK